MDFGFILFLFAALALIRDLGTCRCCDIPCRDEMVGPWFTESGLCLSSYEDIQNQRIAGLEQRVKNLEDQLRSLTITN